VKAEDLELRNLLSTIRPREGRENARSEKTRGQLT
jgi:hypothetical protein